MKRIEAAYDRLALVLFLALAALVIVTLLDYGVGWDEPFHSKYGELVCRYYASLGSDARDTAALEYHNLSRYGGMYDVAGYVAARVLPLGEFESRHALNALVGLLGIVGTWKLARLLGGSRVALIAALFLALTPAYYGHMFNNPKDIPFAAAYIWAVYYLVRLVHALPRPPSGLLVKLSVTIGVTCAVRPGGLILLFYLGLVLLGGAVAEARHRGWRLSSFGRYFGMGLVVTAGAWLWMPLLWPFVFERPLLGPLEALAWFSDFPFEDGMLFRGKYVRALSLPVEYVPTYLAVQLPELILLLLAFSPFAARVAMRRKPVGKDVAAVLLVVFVVAYPVIHVIVSRASLYDAIRHLLFIFPVLAIVAALTADQVVSRLSDASMSVRATLTLLIAGWLVFHLATLAALHPYQYVYFNRFVGGLRGAQDSFVTDYWAQSYNEAVKLLEIHVGDARDVHVRVEGPQEPASYFFPDGWILGDEAETADYVIHHTRYRKLPTPEDVVAVEVVRQGATLSWVADVQALDAETPADLGAQERTPVVRFARDPRWPALSRFVMGSLAVVVTLFIAYKAGTTGFTHDESYSYVVYVPMSIVDIVGAERPLANNHIVNTLAMKLSDAVFPTSELTLRLPNVIALVVYVAACLVLTRRFSPTMRLPVLALMLLNPYLLDFFGLARGYGIAIGLSAMSLVALLDALELGSERRYVRALLLSGIAALANLSFLNLFLGVIAAWQLRLPAGGGLVSPRRLLVHNRATAIATVVLTALMYEPIRKLRKAEAFWYGGVDGFWPDTVQTLVTSTLYGATYPVAVRHALVALVGCAIFLPMARLACTVARRRSNPFSAGAPWLAMAAVLWTMVSSVLIQHALLGVRFPIHRTALFLVPALVLSFTLTLDVPGHRRRIRRIGLATVWLLALLAGLHAARVSTPSWYHDWKYDMHARQVLSDLERRRSATGSRQTVEISAIPRYVPTLEFYQKVDRLDWLGPVQSGASPPPGGYALVTPDDLEAARAAGARVVQHYLPGDAYLVGAEAEPR